MRAAVGRPADSTALGPYDPETWLQRLMPGGPRWTHFDGRVAWVGLGRSSWRGNTPGDRGGSPWVSNFREDQRAHLTARVPRGPEGKWFLSLDAARLSGRSRVGPGPATGCHYFLVPMRLTGVSTNGAARIHTTGRRIQGGVQLLPAGRAALPGPLPGGSQVAGHPRKGGAVPERRTGGPGTMS